MKLFINGCQFSSIEEAEDYLEVSLKNSKFDIDSYVLKVPTSLNDNKPLKYIKMMIGFSKDETINLKDKTINLKDKISAILKEELQLTLKHSDKTIKMFKAKRYYDALMLVNDKPISGKIYSGDNQWFSIDYYEYYGVYHYVNQKFTTLDDLVFLIKTHNANNSIVYTISFKLKCSPLINELINVTLSRGDGIEYTVKKLLSGVTLYRFNYNSSQLSEYEKIQYLKIANQIKTEWFNKDEVKRVNLEIPYRFPRDAKNEAKQNKIEQSKPEENKTDKIITVFTDKTTAYIIVSDGSIIKIGLTENNLNVINEEKDFLTNATIEKVTNAVIDKVFELDYITVLGRKRRLTVKY